MSQIPPPATETTRVIVQPSPSNGLGLAGFITSLVGWVSCGLLCPIGLLLSLIALFKPPRGFAIAGLIIGGLGSTFLATFGLAIILALLGLGAAASVAINELPYATGSLIIQTEYQKTGQLPSDAEGAALLAGVEADGQPLMYRRIDADTYELGVVGPDGVADTTDDAWRAYDAPSVNTSTAGPTSVPTTP